jgi:DNA-binding NtrC family response regulator
MLSAIDGGAASRRQVILVVEDEPIIRFGLALHLEESGFQVIEADDAPSAIAVLQEPGCIVDLVLSDVRMPGEIDGIGLSRWIFENRPNVPVILASGEVGKATALQDLCGAETMTKPFDFSTLTSTIHAAITKKQTPPAC